MLRQVYFFCLSNEFKIYFFNFTALISIDHRSRFSNTDRSNTTIELKYVYQSTNFQQFLTGSVIFHGKSQIFFPQGSILQSCKHRKNCLGNQQVMYQHQNNSWLCYDYKFNFTNVSFIFERLHFVRSGFSYG